MPITHVDLGSTTFDLSKGQLRVDGNAAAMLESEHSITTREHLADDAVQAFLRQDQWIHGCSKLEVILEITIAPDLQYKHGDTLQLLEVLRRSITCAELWKQLNFFSPDESSLFTYEAHCDIFQLTFWLCDKRAFSSNNKVIVPGFYCQNVFNVRPPVCIPSYRLKSIIVSVNFGVTTNAGALSTSSKRVGAVQSMKYNHFVRLMDAVMRSFLCPTPKRLFGVKSVREQRMHCLSSVAPSIFIPGYADDITGRARLIEPIARFLTIYQKRHGNLSGNKKICNSKNEEEEGDTKAERQRIEADLWMTMANALKQTRARQSLKHLRLNSNQASGVYEPAETGPYEMLDNVGFEEVGSNTELTIGGVHEFDDELSFRIFDCATDMTYCDTLADACDMEYEFGSADQHTAYSRSSERLLLDMNDIRDGVEIDSDLLDTNRADYYSQKAKLCPSAFACESRLAMPCFEDEVKELDTVHGTPAMANGRSVSLYPVPYWSLTQDDEHHHDEILDDGGTWQSQRSSGSICHEDDNDRDIMTGF